MFVGNDLLPKMFDVEDIFTIKWGFGDFKDALTVQKIVVALQRDNCWSKFSPTKVGATQEQLESLQQLMLIRKSHKKQYEVTNRFIGILLANGSLVPPVPTGRTKTGKYYA